MIDIGSPKEGETWQTMLLRVSKDVDLVGSFWYDAAFRRNTGNMVRGHFDLSAVLIARQQSSADTKSASWFSKSFTSFLSPFSYSLWAAIIAVIVLSGLVDYIIEVKKVEETSLTGSLYEYFAGFLWGGFEYPLSKSSAVFQLILGFFVLIFVSSYTANLAAFITVKASPANSVTSMDDALINKKVLCSENTVSFQRVKALYPRIVYSSDSGSKFELADKLVALNGCQGMTMMKQDFLGLRTDPKYCKLKIAQVVSPGMGGFYASKESTCVSEAIGYGLTKLDENGELELLIESYFPEPPCAVAAATTSGNGAGRRLARATTAEDSQLDPPGRRLAASAGKTADVASGNDGPSEEVPKMEINDFAGLFVMWAVVSIVAIAVNYAPKRCVDACTPALRCCTSSLHKVAKANICRANHASTGDTDPGVEGGMANVDNEAAMLRKLLQQMAAVHGSLNQQMAEVQGSLNEVKTGLAAERSSGRRRSRMRQPQGHETSPSSRVAGASSQYGTTYDESNATATACAWPQRMENQSAATVRHSYVFDTTVFKP